MTTSQLEFPDHIAHKPVIALPYNAHDPHRENDTDVQFLTVGWSQWDEDIPSAKIVRHTGTRWSRQSEEIPLARLVDLVTLVVRTYADREDALTLEPGFLENQSNEERIKRKSSASRDRLANAMHRDSALRRRLSRLTDELLRLRNERQI